MNKRGEGGESAGIGKIITIVIMVVLLVLVIIFLTNPAARDYIRNLPSFGYANSTNVDEVIEDKLVERVNPCPIQVGEIKITKGGNGISLGRLGRDRYMIYAGKTETNLLITDLHKERAEIYLLETIDKWWQFFKYFNTISYVEVGIVSDPVFDPSIGIKKRTLLISSPYSDKDARDKYRNLPAYSDMQLIQNSYTYNDINLGGIKLCKE